MKVTSQWECAECGVPVNFTFNVKRGANAEAIIAKRHAKQTRLHNRMWHAGSNEPTGK